MRQINICEFWERITTSDKWRSYGLKVYNDEKMGLLRSI